MKVLVFCADLVPLPGLPTSGGGLRSWQWVQTLRRLGHEVIASVPLFTHLARRFADSIPAETIRDGWSLEDQDALVRRHRPDAILFGSSWIVDRLARQPDCFVIQDLCGPQLLEMRYKGERDPSVGGQVKIDRLARADLVILGGERQRYYFLPYLLLAGYAIDEIMDLPVIPLALDPELPALPRRGAGGLEFIAGGGFYPWQDPSPGLLAAAAVVGVPNSGARLKVYGTSHAILGSDELAFRTLRDNCLGHPNVTFHDYAARADWLAAQLRASVAIHLHARNPERELAISTRAVEHLWCGLPVLHNDFDELAALIRQYDAGWTVDPADPDAATAVLREVLRDPGRLEAKRAGAQALVRDRFTYPVAARPLADFLESPRKAPASRHPPARVLADEDFQRLHADRAALDQLHRSRAVRVARRVASLRRAIQGSS